MNEKKIVRLLYICAGKGSKFMFAQAMVVVRVAKAVRHYFFCSSLALSLPSSLPRSLVFSQLLLSHSANTHENVESDTKIH